MPRAVFGEWTPDNPSLTAGSLEALNVYPKTATSYGPFPSLSEYSNALGAYCRGAYSARKSSDGTSHTFAGDATALYKLSGDTFSDVKKTGGYHLTQYDFWEMEQFGDLVISVGGHADAVQSFNLASSTVFADLAATAPKAKHIGIVKDFVMLGDTYDSTFGYQPTRVWWSAINDPTTWPTPATQAAYNVQSDYQNLPTGGSVTRIMAGVGGVDGVIFCESAIHVCTYEGAPYIFRLHEADPSRGTKISRGCAHAGGFIAFIAEDGFYAFNGATSTPIGDGKIDKWFFSKLEQAYDYRITSSVDPINKLIIWSFPDGTMGDTPNCLVIYNWKLGRWAHAEITCEMIFRSRSSDRTLESLDSDGDIDTLPFSLDSRALIGGKLVLSGFSTGHKLSYFSGPSLAATITTSEFSDENGLRMFVSGVRPLVEGGASATVSLSSRDSLTASETEGAESSAGPDGICPQRKAGRYFRANVKIPAGETWSHAVGVEPVWRMEGKR